MARPARLSHETTSRRFWLQSRTASTQTLEEAPPPGANLNSTVTRISSELVLKGANQWCRLRHDALNLSDREGRVNPPPAAGARRRRHPLDWPKSGPGPNRVRGTGAVGPVEPKQNKNKTEIIVVHTWPLKQCKS